jgi:hypothetical protein
MEAVMLLRFLGEIGVYIPERDAIQFTALSGGDLLDCYVTRSALEVIGCDQRDRAESLVDRFQDHRALIELAATVKDRRSRPGSILKLEGPDLQGLSQDLTQRLRPGFSPKSFDMEG